MGLGGDWRIEQNPPGHAQMQYNRLTAGQADKNIFASPIKAQNFGACDLLGKIGGNPPSQIVPTDNGLHNGAILQGYLHTAHHGFYFGEFRHGYKAGYRGNP